MRRLGTVCLALAVSAGASGYLQITARAQSASAAAGGTLGALATGITSGPLAVIDLTQVLNVSTPIVQLPPPFANTPGFKSHQISAGAVMGGLLSPQRACLEVIGAGCA
ncbi:MAG TPA: hypothetical protein VG222_06180 [Vicinamibacterales bacterium]|nr:hypothetical protein [Vicinamibacterales bacterium]